jgi:3-oxoadipate enol-lactonase
LRVYANGIGINYQLQGSGPPLTLVHALGLDLRQWRWQVPTLADRHQVLRYDVRGHGRSDTTPGPYSLELLSEDLYGLLQALGIPHTDLLGLSMGGMIAQTFALTHPEMVGSLILADTTSEYDPDARRQFEERARVAETQGMDPLVQATVERWFTPDFRQTFPMVVDEIRAILRQTDPTGYAASCRAVARLDLTPRLQRIASPTLVLVGDEDPSTPPAVARRIHEEIAGSRFEVIHGAAHLSSVAQPDQFNSLVLGFLGA